MPGPPTGIKVISKDGNPLVHVSWKPPLRPNGAIRKYRIQFQLQKAFNTSKELDDNIIVEVDHTVSFYNISTLPVRTIYVVTVCWMHIEEIMLVEKQTHGYRCLLSLPG